ncbi:MAG: sigma-54 dependent transcriptional regulator [Verrucomicrobiia bacterium]
MGTMGVVVVIDDEPAMTRTLREIFSFRGYHVLPFADAKTALVALRNTKVDLVVTDVHLPGMNGIDLLKVLREEGNRTPMILITGQATADLAIEGIQAGAFDFVEKPFQPEMILELAAKAIQTNKLASQTVRLGEVFLGASRKPSLVGKSAAMLEVCKFVGRVAATPVNVLIQGATGTGKELVARAIFQHSDRRNAPFLAVNCMAIPEDLLESELFGHERGAFTGAQIRRIGRFEQASRGTLFLDEIGDLQPALQVKLLRVLQEKVIQRLGSNVDIPVETRVIAATHRDLAQEVAAGRFREDLYYRLTVAVVTLPPLAERKEDIPGLVEHFLQLHGPDFGQPRPTITAEAVELLVRQPWPGNVRELENVLRKALIESAGRPLTAGLVAGCLYVHVPALGEEEGMRGWLRARLDEAEMRGEKELYRKILSELDAALLGEVMRRCGNNKVKAAELTGLSRPTLYQKLSRLGSGEG